MAYRVVSGTAYNVDTPDQIINWLETSRVRKQRIRLFFGDSQTGLDWMEEYETMGYVGRSMGTIKVPLLIKNSGSSGGCEITSENIVRIATRGEDGSYRDVYCHPAYHQPQMRIGYRVSEYPAYVEMLDSKNGWSEHAAFETREKAQRWVAFMKGERNSK